MTDKYHTSQRIARIISAELLGLATPEQLTELTAWLDEKESNRQFYEQLKNEPYRLQRFQEYVRYDSRRDWQNVKAVVYPKRKLRWRRVLPYAAILILALGITAIFRNKTTPELPIVAQQIEPGRSQARLILPDGKVVELEKRGQGDSLAVSEHVVNKGHELAYRTQDELTASRLHVLQVPRGGEYQLLLADGTRVWLNAASELRYPDHFTGEVRSVELRGEAYFEVAKDAQHPFYVQVDGMEVKVLGTSFNVSAYQGETTHTTLVEGKVTVAAGSQQLEIKPGEQALMEQGELKVRPVKVENYTGWISQRFVYEDKLLGEVLHDLERWYDVKILWADPQIGQLHFTANLPKYARMEQVLEIIAYAACVKFEVNNRNVSVEMDQ